jgi:hypothetical protein
VSNLQTLGRTLLTVLAQGLSSVTNFTAGALALDAADGDLGAFGRFAIAFQLCQVVIAIGEGSVGSSVLIHTAQRDVARRAAEIGAGAATAAIVVGIGLGIPIAIVGFVVGDNLGALLILAAVGSPGLVAQYTLRSSRFARQDPAGVVRADTIWLAVVLAAAFGDWFGAWDPNVNGYFAAWIVGATLSASPMLLTGFGSGRRQLSTFWSATGPQAIRIGIDSLLARSAFVVTLAAAGVIVGDESSGLLAATVLVFSPLSVIHSSILAVVVPTQIRDAGIHVARWRVPIVVFVGVSGITLVWAAVLLGYNETPWALGPFDLDANNITITIFLATLLRFLGLAFWRGPLVALRVADAASESLRARAIGTTAQWIFAIVGLLVAETNGGAFGLAFATWLGAGAAWHQYRNLREPSRSGSAG